MSVKTETRLIHHTLFWAALLRRTAVPFRFEANCDVPERQLAEITSNKTAERVFVRRGCPTDSSKPDGLRASVHNRCGKRQAGNSRLEAPMSHRFQLPLVVSATGCFRGPNPTRLLTQEPGLRERANSRCVQDGENSRRKV